MPADSTPPDGYTYFKDGPYKEITKAKDAKAEYPEVHVDIGGLIQYGEADLTRYDQELLNDWEKAKNEVLDLFDADGAPNLDDVDKFIIGPLKRNCPWNIRWGLREGLNGLIREIRTGSPVVAVEQWVGRARVDWVISIIEGVDLQVPVEYKHWTAVKDDVLYERANKLQNQLEEYIHHAPKKNYRAVIVKWPRFQKLGSRARGLFRRTLLNLQAYAASQNVALVLELD